MNVLIAICMILTILLAVGLGVGMFVLGWVRKSFLMMLVGIFSWLPIYVFTALLWPLFREVNDPGSGWWNDPWDNWFGVLVPDLGMIVFTVAALLLAALGQIPGIGLVFRFLARLIAALLLIVAILAIDLGDPWRLLFPGISSDDNVPQRTCRSLYDELAYELLSPVPNGMTRKEQTSWSQERDNRVLGLRERIKGNEIRPGDPVACLRAEAPTARFDATLVGDCGLRVGFQVSGLSDAYENTNRRLFTVVIDPKADANEGDPKVNWPREKTHRYTTGGTKYPVVTVTDMMGTPFTTDTSTDELSRCEDDE